MSANSSSAVMQQRREPKDSLDFFPTPPWATRALIESVLEQRHAYAPSLSVWEPACGEGHMAEVLSEYFAKVYASDIQDYGRGYAIGDFTGTLLRSECHFRPDWVISNPPFNLAAEFVERALGEARCGVAMLLRLAWLEGGDRYRRLFSKIPPSTVAVFSGRVAMVKGRYDPDASSATAYAWFIWNANSQGNETVVTWIPPEAERAFTHAADINFIGGEK